MGTCFEDVVLEIMLVEEQETMRGGKAGEVVVEDIKWIRTDEGRYRLVVEGLD